MYKLLGLLLAGLFLFPPAIAQAPNPTSPDENDNIIIQENSVKAKHTIPLKFQTLGTLIYDIVDCESKWRENAIGKAGEIGLAQFKPKTFEWLSGLAGHILDINSPEDQLWLLRWALENNYGKHWTCYGKLTR